MADRPYETRTVTANIELRDDTTDAAPVITGYASTFNQPYQVGYFREQIHPDAFKRTLAGSPDVRLLIDHEGQPLARTKSGTLTLSTDSRGLAVSATLDPSDPDVQRLLPKMRRGDLDQMSFAFRVPVEGDVWDYSGDMPTRTIREANLSGGDVSVVTYPANENASAQVRARDEQEAAFTLADAMLREMRSGRGFDEANSSRLHTALVALGFQFNSVTPAAPAAKVTFLRTPPATAADRRAAADMTYNDRESALSDALTAQYGPTDDDGDSDGYDMWLVDATDEWVVWRVYDGDNSGLWRVAYTLDDDGAVTFDGDPEQVTAATSYTPVVAAARGTSLELAKRSAESLALRHQRA